MNFKDFQDSKDSINFRDQLAKARQGSADDKAEILESFRQYLRTIAARTIATDPQAQLSASDLVQSAIIDAYRGFQNCRATNQEEFKAWIRQILLNDILNRYRDLKRQKRDIRKEVPLSGQALTEEGALSPDAQVSQNEDQARLEAAIAKLTPEQQTVIHFRHRDKLTFPEIGEKMNKSADAARMLWNRAVDELARNIASQ